MRKVAFVTVLLWLIVNGSNVMAIKPSGYGRGAEILKEGIPPQIMLQSRVVASGEEDVSPAQAIVMATRKLEANGVRGVTVMSVTPLVDIRDNVIAYDIDFALLENSEESYFETAKYWQEWCADRTQKQIAYVKEGGERNQISRDIERESPAPYASVTVSASYDCPAIRCWFRGPSNYYSGGWTAFQIATEILGGEQISLDKIYLTGPLSRAWVFSSKEQTVVVEGQEPFAWYSYDEFRDDALRSYGERESTVSSLLSQRGEDFGKVRDSLRAVHAKDVKTLLNDVNYAESAEHLIWYYESFEPFEWHYGCAPTAAAMVLNYWENASWYGLLNSWFSSQYDLVEGDQDCHVATLQADLAIYMETSETGGTVPSRIHDAMRDLANYWGYSFTNGIDWTGYTLYWHWDEIRTAIDAGEPFVWTLDFFPGAGGSRHSVAAVGYTDEGDVMCHSTWYTNGDQLVYASHEGGLLDLSFGAAPERGGSILYDCKLISPDGHQGFAVCGYAGTYTGGTDLIITWNNFGIPGDHVELDYSVDGGSTWSLIDSSPDDGEYIWTLPLYMSTNQGRVRIRQYSDATTVVSRDGSYGNFQVVEGDTPLLPPTDLLASDGDWTYKIRLTWEGAYTADQYDIYRNNINDPISADLMATTEAVYDVYYDDEDVVEGVRYYYWVKSRRLVPPATSDFSEGVWGMAGAPLPTVPYKAFIRPSVVNYCGDTVIYSLELEMWESDVRCLREDMFIEWRVTDCPGAWFEIDGVNEGQIVNLTSIGSGDEKIPTINYDGLSACDANVTFSVVGYENWTASVLLHLDPVCPSSVSPIHTIESPNEGTQHLTNVVKFDPSGDAFVGPKGGMFNLGTTLFNTTNLEEMCPYDSGADSRDFSPTGDSIFTVRDRDWESFSLCLVDECEVANTYSLLDAEAVVWSNTQDRVAVNAEEYGHYHEVRIINPGDGTVLNTLATVLPSAYIHDLSWRNERLAAAGEMRKVVVWSTTSDSYANIWNYYEENCAAWASSCDLNSLGTKLAVAWETDTDPDCLADNFVIFDVANGNKLESLLIDNETGKLTDVCWSPDDSKILLMGNRGFARIIDAETMTPFLDLDMGEAYGDAWCDWSAKDMIVVRVDSEIKIFTPFDVSPPTLSTVNPESGYESPWDTVTVTGTIFDDYSLDPEMVQMNVNGGDWTNIFDTSWSFSQLVQLTESVNVVAFRMADRSGHFGYDTLIINRETAVEEIETDELPGKFALSQNYPNPFNPSTVIEFSLPTRSMVTIKVYNLLGQEIVRLADEELPAGYHRVTWDGKASGGERVSSGIYFYRIETNDFVQSKKMLLIK